MSMAHSKVMCASEAVSHIQSGDTIMVGGFGLRGCPFELVDALIETGQRELTIISVGGDSPGIGLGALLRSGQIKKMIGSFYNANREVAMARNSGQIEVVLMPMGNLAEALRAGGMGIPAFYVPAGAGTDLAVGKEVRIFDGRPHILVDTLHADVALIRAKTSDALGNLVYSKTARNFNPAMATAADFTIAVVDEIVEPGALSPDEIITSHIYVDALVLAGGCRHD